MILINAITIFLLLFGLFFTFVGSIGLLRFPDFYTRLHATGKCDTLGAGLAVLGLGVYHIFHYSCSLLVVAKLAFLIMFIFIANPTATHAIIKAAEQTGVKPWKLGDNRR